MVRHSLDRLLRLRSLLEDVSRVELEICTQELARIETALACSEETVKAMRRRTFSGIAGDRNSDRSGDRMEAEALAEWAEWESGIFERARQKKMVESEIAKAAYLERRKECAQVRSVIEVRAAAAAVEKGRREQRELDDWFGQRSRRRRDGGNGPA